MLFEQRRGISQTLANARSSDTIESNNLNTPVTLMTPAFFTARLENYSASLGQFIYLRYFLSGLLLPLSFAPFHLPGLAILGLALFYYGLMSEQCARPFYCGLLFGLGFFGLGVSWIYVSIHMYGHLHGMAAAVITLLFLLYLSLFPAMLAVLFTRLAIKKLPVCSGFLFSALWIGTEYLRSVFFSGFPWLQLGFGQFDAPVKFLLPIVGVYGVGFLTCLAATLLSNSTRAKGLTRSLHLIFFVTIVLLPLVFKNVTWAHEKEPTISVGVIQANLSMRDKWNEDLFWELLRRYQKETEQLLGTQLIVMPESAIPLPATYISDFLSNLKLAAKKAGSAILLGIPKPTSVDEDYYFNSLISLGKAKGTYFKQHLVPFGEYIPRPFQYLSNRLGIPDANLKPGKTNQSLLSVHHHPVASLICYELAYGELLRQQLPLAEWIVSISDDGWFGHSLAMYQQLQMAQVRSLQTARFHVVSNNDGLSSVINTVGKITSSLPAYTEGILKANIFPSSGATPWVTFGDLPALLFSLLVIFVFVVMKLLLRISRGAILTNLIEYY